MLFCYIALKRVSASNLFRQHACARKLFGKIPKITSASPSAFIISFRGVSIAVALRQADEHRVVNIQGENLHDQLETLA